MKNPNNTYTLSEQQSLRRQGSRGVVGNLTGMPKSFFDQADRDDYIVRLAQDRDRFLASYPQLVVEGPQGMANYETINTWLVKQGVAGEFKNLVAAFNDLVSETLYVFHPTTGQIIQGLAVRNLDIRNYEKVINPAQDGAKPIEKMSAADFKEASKAANPSEWQDPRATRREADFVKKAVNDFLSLRPNYPVDESCRELILDTVKAAGLPINATTLTTVFDQLVAQKKIFPNEHGVYTWGNTRRFDFSQTIPRNPSV